MPQKPSNLRVFFREFLRNFQSTGAILPSGRWLCSSLSRYVRSQGPGRKILEVGPGTGAVTKWIVSSLQANDRLDLVEVNDEFVRRLNERFLADSKFRLVSDQVRIFHQRVEEMPTDEKYDLIVSGLPLNNFSIDDVEQHLAILLQRLAPGGTLSFFEYIALRPIKALVSRRAERQRLRGVAKAIRQIVRQGRFRRDWVFPNVPPAKVHHIRWDSESTSTRQASV